MKETTYKLTVSYDGTPFYGWQRQASKPTVQLALEQAVKACWSKSYSIQGSGRTDTGVHAKGQVAHFRAPQKFQPATLVRALNHHLPKEIRVTQCQLVPASFHARFSAKKKEYVYRIVNDEVFPPFELNRAWHVPRKLDVHAIRNACAYLEGTHDFASFTSNPGYARTSTIRTLEKIQVAQKGSLITLRVRGNGFLYRMVRNLVGALVKVGHGRLQPDDIGKILKKKSRPAAPNTAPACGLYLNKVFYSHSNFLILA